MRKIFPILLFLCFFAGLSAFSEEIEINAAVITVNPGAEFFIIGSGEDTDLEIGDGVLVHRDGEKIAEAYIVEVRPNVSAAEILRIENNNEIHEGDQVLIVKEPKKAKSSIMPMAARLSPAVITSSYTMPSAVIEQADSISLDIRKDPKAVFSYARLILRENGYSVIDSNRAAGTLLATKPIKLNLIKELWADATAAIDHKLVASFEIKGKGSASTLTVTSFKEHAQKARQVKRALAKDSKYYNELISLVSKIKERSEY